MSKLYPKGSRKESKTRIFNDGGEKQDITARGAKKAKNPSKTGVLLVPGEGVEPSRRITRQRILSPVRLPFRHPGKFTQNINVLLGFLPLSALLQPAFCPLPLSLKTPVLVSFRGVSVNTLSTPPPAACSGVGWSDQAESLNQVSSPRSSHPSAVIG